MAVKGMGIMSSRKWLREHKAKQDRKQTLLNPQAEKGITEKGFKAEIKGLNLNDMIACPFCLHIGKAKEFVFSVKHGYHQGMGKCPECKNKARWRSLTSKWTPEQYAEWVYNYATQGFWEKCPFEKWKERLYKIRWSFRFWKRYKELKGEDEEERETIIEKQEKDRWVCPNCGEKNEPHTTFCWYCKTRLIESYG